MIFQVVQFFMKKRSTMMMRMIMEMMTMTNMRKIRDI
jgi:hypothetical protein